MDYKATDFPFTIMDVASLLRLNIRRRGSGHIYVDCPICGDRRGKMNLNLTKNIWRCNYCGEGGGMLALYAKVYGISNSDAYKEICDALQTGSHALEYQPQDKAAHTKETPQSERANILVIHHTFSALMAKEIDMSNLSIKQRNTLVEEHLWCIDSVIWQNYSLIQAARLELDDVYQSLAIRLIRAVELYNPDNKAGKTLKNYIFMSLRYALRTCGGSQAQYGFREAPYFLPNAVVSMEALEESDPYWEMRIAA